MDFSTLFEEQSLILNKVNLNFKRSFYANINFNENRFIAILGQRGVGKTTLILQYIKEHYENDDSVLYVSVDNPYFQSISLYDFAKSFEKIGGKILFIDEIHKLKDFAIHLKAIYDSTDLKIIISGSSLLQIYKKNADLSRRLVAYYMPNLSFREYLELKEGIAFDCFSFENILENHIEIAKIITSDFKPLKYFRKYLTNGAYPFIIEGYESYKTKLINILNHIIEVDLPYVNNVSYANIDKIKKLLYILSVSVPFTPNISELSNSTSISRPMLVEYLYHLEKAHLIINMQYNSKSYSKLKKPDKIFLNNTNLMRVISNETNIGNERETFFINQIKNYFENKESFINENILLFKSGDFIINNKYIFEVGGKNKSFNQIKNLDNSFVVSDNMEIGFKNKIPLWLFGFLY